MNELHRWMPGEKVTVFRGGIGRDEPAKVTTVKRALTRFVELADGTKWDPRSGKPYPYRQGYWGPCIRPWSPVHDEQIGAAKKLHAVEAWVFKMNAVGRCSRLAPDQIEALHEVISGIQVPK